MKLIIFIFLFSCSLYSNDLNSSFEKKDSNNFAIYEEKINSINNIIGRQDRIIDNLSNDISFYSILLTVLMLAFTVLSSLNSRNEAKQQAIQATEELKSILKLETDEYISNWIKTHGLEEINKIKLKYQEKIIEVTNDSSKTIDDIKKVMNILFDNVTEDMTELSKTKVVKELGNLKNLTTNELLDNIDKLYNQSQYAEAAKVSLYSLSRELNILEKAKINIYLGKLSSYINQNVNEDKKNTKYYDYVIDLKNQVNSTNIDDKLLYEILLAQHFRTGRRIITGQYEEALEDANQITKYFNYAYNNGNGKHKVKILEIIACAMINKAIIYDYQYNITKRIEVVDEIDTKLKDFIEHNISNLKLFKKNLHLKLETAFQYEKNTYFEKELCVKFLKNNILIDIFNLLEESKKSSNERNTKIKNLKGAIVTLDYDFSNLKKWAKLNKKDGIYFILNSLGDLNDFNA